MRLIVVEFMTLDGVMEAPGFEEHRTGRNAWALEVGDDELQAYNGEQLYGSDALLFGRTTFHIWEAFWPTAPGDRRSPRRASTPRRPRAVRSSRRMASASTSP